MQKTLQNMAAAFIGESQARNRYTIYAKIAKKEGYEQISEIFLETADQEREHAKWLMRMINGLQEKSGGAQEEIKVEAGAPTVIGNTIENLKAAIGGENHEYTSMYPEFADTAMEEDLKAEAARMRFIARAEQHHEERYKKLLEQVEAGTVFKKEEEVSWICRKCGYEHNGTTPPEECPACGHPVAYYQVKNEVY